MWVPQEENTTRKTHVGSSNELGADTEHMGIKVPAWRTKVKLEDRAGMGKSGFHDALLGNLILNTHLARNPRATQKNLARSTAKPRF